MSTVLTPDICVIGGGAAGLTVAAAAASFGVSTVLIEKDRLGGECLHSGCVPSKALIAAAARAHDVRTASRFGVMAAEPEIDFTAVMTHVREVIATVGRNDTAERFGGLGVTVLHGAARFSGPRTVVVGESEIRARRFLVATGSRPLIPPIPNLETVPYLTNETIFGLVRRPTHLMVVGAGPTGLELAQAFRRLGSEVSVLEAGSAIASADREMAALLLESLRSEGIAIRENARIARVARRGRSGIRLTLDEPGGPAQLDGTQLLIAAGRRPNVEDLGLADARVTVGPAGIAVDSRMRTSNRRIYAIGDVVNGPHSTHLAGEQAAHVVRGILFRLGGRQRLERVPSAIFTDPEFARVGWTEAEARQRVRGVQVMRWPFSENDRAQTGRRTRGCVKLVSDRRGRILGAEILGDEAGELIALWSLAVTHGLTLRSVVSTVMPYPTLSESGRRAALAFYAAKLRSPWVRRLIRFLRIFG